MEISVFSSYPEKSLIHGNKTVGVGNYTKATLTSLTKIMGDANFKVIAEILEQKDKYIENKIIIERTWKRGNVLSIILSILKSSYSNADVIIFPFEMFMFGGFLHLALILPFMTFFKIKNKKVILVLHQIIGDEFTVFEQNKIKRLFFRFIKPIFYKFLLFISNKVIVFEEEFRHRLGKSDKVEVIPHAVLTENVLNKKEAKAKLGLDENKKYIFYFGFLAAYKGVDKLINIWEELGGVNLIIGGGGNPNHLKDPQYQKYIQSIVDSAKGKGIITTGFIPQDQMSCYFSSVDLVVFPYTVFMSSSGPLSHCFSYGRGVLLSSALRNYFNSVDMKKALDEAGISI